jgi:hypothetical protein
MTAARILVERNWYEPLASQAFLEIEYERLVAQAAPDIFPGHTWIDLKITVESPHGPAKPDFVLIADEYQGWWVGEAELSHHSFTGHVLPQVERLATATYDDALASRLLARRPELSAPKVKRLMKGVPPRVLIVVNQPSPEWDRDLAQWGAQVAVVEVFRSYKGRHVLLVSGNLPEPPGALISVCRVDKFLRNMLTVESPGALPEAGDAVILIRYEGRISEWVIVEVADNVWLRPTRAAPPFDPRAEIELIRTSEGDLEFREHKARLIRVSSPSGNAKGGLA